MNRRCAPRSARPGPENVIRILGHARAIRLIVTEEVAGQDGRVRAEVALVEGRLRPREAA